MLDCATLLGYEGVELRLLNGALIDPRAHRGNVEQAVEHCRARHVDVCAFDTSCTLNQADPASGERTNEELEAWIALARTCDVHLLRVFGGASSSVANNGHGEETAADERVADALRRIVPAAARSRVTVALETHDAFSSARRVARVLARTASPFIGALWDSHHPHRAGESPAKVIEALGSRLAHVHVKDAPRSSSGGDNWQLVMLGEGEVPVREQLASLHDTGYRGWISVEWEKKWHPEIAAPEVSLPQHIAWIRHVLAGLPGTQDGAAQEGCMPRRGHPTA